MYRPTGFGLELHYIPETKEDLTFIDVFKAANSNIKLFGFLKYRKQKYINNWVRLAGFVTSQVSSAE